VSTLHPRARSHWRRPCHHDAVYKDSVTALRLRWVTATWAPSVRPGSVLPRSQSCGVPGGRWKRGANVFLGQAERRPHHLDARRA